MSGSVLYMLYELVRCCRSFSGAERGQGGEEREWAAATGPGASLLTFERFHDRRFQSFRTPQAPLSHQSSGNSGRPAFKGYDGSGSTSSGSFAPYQPPPTLPSRSAKPAQDELEDGSSMHAMGDAAAQMQALIDAAKPAGQRQAEAYERAAAAARDMYTSRDEEAYHRGGGDHAATPTIEAARSRTAGAGGADGPKRRIGGMFGKKSAKKGGAGGTQTLGTSNVAKYVVGGRVTGLGKRHELSGTVTEVAPTFPGASNGPGTITIEIDGNQVV